MTRSEAKSLSEFINRCAAEGGGRYLAEPLFIGTTAWVLLVDRETGDCPAPVAEVVDFVEALDRAQLCGEAVPPGCRELLLAWLIAWMAGDNTEAPGCAEAPDAFPVPACQFTAFRSGDLSAGYAENLRSP
jgi:hypothetical protein